MMILLKAKLRALSICQNWPARPVSSTTEYTDLKDKFYRRPSDYFKIARTILGVINFQDFAEHHPFKTMHSIYRLTGLACQFWQLESVLKYTFFG